MVVCGVGSLKLWQVVKEKNCSLFVIYFIFIYLFTQLMELSFLIILSVQKCDTREVTLWMITELFDSWLSLFHKTTGERL